MQKQQIQFPRQKYYINPQNWKIDNQKGGIIYINQTKKKNQSKIIKFVIEKFMENKTFMGISFPVFSMKAESILQSYAKAISTAPLLFEGINNPVQRMKKFVCFVFSFSLLFTDLEKPFNPIIGQTFQSNIGGGSFMAQQISHHPPISSFIFYGKGYKIHSHLQLSASVNVNSASGMFLGDLFLQFENGGKIRGRLPNGQISGFVIGNNRFLPKGSCYAYDSTSKIVCNYENTKKDHFEGFIGKLKSQYHSKFIDSINNLKRFQKFKIPVEKQYEKIFSIVSAVWSQSVSFDGQQYLNYSLKKWLPFEPELPKEKILLSDSRNRQDLLFLKENKLQESQKAKENIEDIERRNLKLRTVKNK